MPMLIQKLWTSFVRLILYVHAYSKYDESHLWDSYYMSTLIQNMMNLIYESFMRLILYVHTYSKYDESHLWDSYYMSIRIQNMMNLIYESFMRLILYAHAYSKYDESHLWVVYETHIICSYLFKIWWISWMPTMKPFFGRKCRSRACIKLQNATKPSVLCHEKKLQWQYHNWVVLGWIGLLES